VKTSSSSYFFLGLGFVTLKLVYNIINAIFIYIPNSINVDM